MRTIAAREGRRPYNYRHFRPRHLLADALAVYRLEGVPPGALAPDFELPDTNDAIWRLSELRGYPVLLHFGSYTCPLNVGSVEPLKKLYARWGNNVEFVTIVVRQGHPGPAAPPYRSFAHKAADAAAHQLEDALPWTVLVDDVDGRVHRLYGLLPNPTFLIDVDGRVAFYNAVTHAPTLHRAIEELMRREGRGIVLGGYDRRPHVLSLLAGGWPALQRGLPHSVLDVETALPGIALLSFLGYQLRRLLAPVALRAEPLPAGARLALVGAGLAILGILSGRRRARMPRRLAAAR